MTVSRCKKCNAALSPDGSGCPICSENEARREFEALSPGEQWAREVKAERNSNTAAIPKPVIIHVKPKTSRKKLPRFRYFFLSLEPWPLQLSRTYPTCLITRTEVQAIRSLPLFLQSHLRFQRIIMNDAVEVRQRLIQRTILRIPQTDITMAVKVQPLPFINAANI